ncbi:MAG TPA: peptidylprolyl isomerase, partial [Stellaceae bacterium]|nr:peptidylprolyl isomerase [Stellaceae bacterium]
MRLVFWLLAVLLGLGGVSLAASAAEGPVVRTRQAAARPPAPVASPPGEYAEMRIAAVVNDQVISVADLDSRIRMVLLSTGLTDSLDTRKRVAAQVLRTMIDEKLQMQEAKRKNVAATADELKKAVASIAKQNHMEMEQLEAVLKSRGIALSALTDQLTASIVWAKLVRQLAAEANPVSDEEIDDALKRIKQTAGEPQTRVAEIFLAVDNPQQDDEVRQLALRLTDQMKQGARFSAVAQQFSQSATAATGGDLGWIRPEALTPELAKAVTQMQPGELSPPIRTPAGYYLLLVLDRRNGRSSGGGGGPEETKLHIVQVVFPLPPQATETQRRAAIAEAETARQAAKDCPDMLRIGKQRAPQLSSEGDLRLNQIAPAMRSMVLGLGIGKASQPIIEKNGVGVIMV